MLFEDKLVKKPLMLDDIPLIYDDKPSKNYYSMENEYENYINEPIFDFKKKKKPELDTINETPKKLVGLPEISNDSKTNNYDIFEDFLTLSPKVRLEPKVRPETYFSDLSTQKAEKLNGFLHVPRTTKSNRQRRPIRTNPYMGCIIRFLSLNCQNGS